MSPNAGARKDQQSLHYIIRSGLAGGIAGCVAKTVVAPLDRVKILFQASNPDFQKYAGSWRGAFLAGSEIYSRSGFWGLFQGHSATLYRVFPYAAIKFMAYDQFHHALMPTQEHETNIRRFMAGAFSGVSSVFCTYPLEVIRVRMAFHTRNLNTPTATPARPSFTHAARFIYREGAGYSESSTAITKGLLNRFPILKFYRGFAVTVLGMVPYAGVSFLSWGYLRSQLLSPSNKEATPIADLVIGAISGVVGQTTSYPLEVVRRRMQVGGITRPYQWITSSETVRAIYQASGWRGFYVGLSIGYLKVVPMTAVSFAVWQNCKRLLDV